MWFWSCCGAVWSKSRGVYVQIFAYKNLCTCIYLHNAQFMQWGKSVRGRCVDPRRCGFVRWLGVWVGRWRIDVKTGANLISEASAQRAFLFNERVFGAHLRPASTCTTVRSIPCRHLRTAGAEHDSCAVILLACGAWCSGVGRVLCEHIAHSRSVCILDTQINPRTTRNPLERVCGTTCG